MKTKEQIKRKIKKVKAEIEQAISSRKYMNPQGKRDEFLEGDLYGQIKTLLWIVR